MLHVGPPAGTAIREGVYLRRGALPRPPDRIQVVDELPDELLSLRDQVLQQFTPAARRLAR